MGSALNATGEIILWGNGCLRADMAMFRLVPSQDGCLLAVKFQGNHPERSFERSISAVELAAFLVGLRQVLEIDAADGARFSTSGIGSIYVTLPLREERPEVTVNQDLSQRLVRVADYLLAFLHASGVALDDDMHPVPRPLRDALAEDPADSQGPDTPRML
jgi:hypothetical protein